MTRLGKYTHGTWSGFINRPTNIDINKQFIVFSVRDMEDELKPIAMYIITHFIWNAVRHELKKRLLIIDEAWWMMKSEDTASFLYSVAKRGRKYYLGVATIVEDFLRSPYGRAHPDQLLHPAPLEAVAHDYCRAAGDLQPHRRGEIPAA